LNRKKNGLAANTTWKVEAKAIFLVKGKKKRVTTKEKRKKLPERCGTGCNCDQKRVIIWRWRVRRWQEPKGFAVDSDTEIFSEQRTQGGKHRMRKPPARKGGVGAFDFSREKIRGPWKDGKRI